jgi:branched-subunit amino acid aminotransferase/4-amino-4-deoxychorismate lyase
LKAVEGLLVNISTSLAYLNGRLLPQDEACLPLHDAGLVLGATVTDLCRTFNRHPFRLPDHLRRFRQSCLLARVPQPLSDEELTRIAGELVRHNAALLGPGQELALVLLATPGPVGYYLGQPGGPGDGPPTLVLHTFPLPFARYHRLVREGARLVVPSVRHVPAASIDPRIKQRSRLHWWLADQEVHQADPLTSALLLNEHGHVTETAAANFLLVRGGAVLTPPRGSVLGGISLQVTEELCGQLGFPFREQPLTAEDCRHADEAWLASTPYCLAGVRQINGVELPCPGPLLGRLLEAWNALTGCDICRQILSNR